MVSVKRCNVSVGIPTFRRTKLLEITLREILSCNPLPEEIIIHVDFGDEETIPFIERAFSDHQEIRIITSEQTQGPGGGRNRILEEAHCPLIASFDDDSYPLDKDYFQRVVDLGRKFEDAAILSASIYHIDEDLLPSTIECYQVAFFIGCGCVYRKKAFLNTNGYVPLRYAYGMEEIDLAIQLAAQDQKIIECGSLRVFHNTKLYHHFNEKVNAASIANLALLTFLRYPVFFYLKGIMQILNRTLWLIRHKRYKGIMRGYLEIIPKLYRYRKYREVVDKSKLRNFFRLRDHKIRIS